MFCPRCGQEQVSEETRYCSRCGFLMTGVGELISSGGQMSGATDLTVTKESPRKKGLKQGLMIFLLTFLIVPLVAITSVNLMLGPTPIAITAILFSVGGILRMVYALLLESNQPDAKTLEENVFGSAQGLLNKNKTNTALPPQQTMPASVYTPPIQGNWRDTNDLVQPSVTEGTTKLLEREDKNQ